MSAVLRATDAQLKDVGLDISHHWVEDEVYLKRVLFRAGAQVPQHVHPFDHASALVRGTVRLEVDGVATEHTGPKVLLIQANRQHNVTAVTDVVWYCIHITDDTDPATVDSSILKV